ncbi:Hypothetical predicted protein [Olea europaea subsp. europaea]|uniref:Uncharacterized protein n=1 Tax=Olea europaea subsp. europaea TaxID=158383 RepID=A0A8S0UNS3_OLEEU|nr:Hypothetical predicted protein [Olea europaea subsp. europaea]
MSISFPVLPFNSISQSYRRLIGRRWRTDRAKEKLQSMQSMMGENKETASVDVVHAAGKHCSEMENEGEQPSFSARRRGGGFLWINLLPFSNFQICVKDGERMAIILVHTDGLQNKRLIGRRFGGGKCETKV